MPSKRTRTRSKGAHGVVRQVGVRTSSTESHRSAPRRTQRRSYAERRQRRLSRRGLAIGLSVALVALLAAAVAGVAVFFSTSDSKLALTESNAKEALVEPEEGKAYYALCAAQLGTATRAADPATDAYLLVRIDEGARKLTFVAIPSNVTVAAAGQDGMPLYDVRAQRGDAELVRQVASLAGVDIAHFAYTNAQGLEGMVGAVGGVDMALAEEVDDPQAGIIVLAAGERKLTGAEALVFLRATNFAGGFETASLNRIDFTVALAERALSSQGFDLAAILGDLGRYVSTDYTAQGLMALGDALRPVDELTVYRAVMAGHTSANSGMFVYDDDAWKALMEVVGRGDDPQTADALGAAVNTSEVTVEVRNGSQSTGMAAGLAKTLEGEGYQVGPVGNTGDGIIYPETLIVYKDEAMRPAARAISGEMGGGRIINGGDFYSFSTDVLVIIGRDWMPVA